jgi:hypothetical protein
LLLVRPEGTKISDDGLDGQQSRSAPKLLQERFAAIDRGNGIAPFRQWHGMQAEACPQVDRDAAPQGERKVIEFRSAPCKCRIEVADHPRVDGAEVYLVMIACRCHRLSRGGTFK